MINGHGKLALKYTNISSPKDTCVPFSFIFSMPLIYIVYTKELEI